MYSVIVLLFVCYVFTFFGQINNNNNNNNNKTLETLMAVDMVETKVIIWYASAAISPSEQGRTVGILETKPGNVIIVFEADYCIQLIK